MERVPNIDAALAPPGDCCQSPFDSSPRDWHAQCSAPLRQPLARRPLASVAAHYGGDRSVSHASSSTATGGEGDGEGDSQASVSIAFDEGCGPYTLPCLPRDCSPFSRRGGAGSFGRHSYSNSSGAEVCSSRGAGTPITCPEPVHADPHGLANFPVGASAVRFLESQAEEFCGRFVRQAEEEASATACSNSTGSSPSEALADQPGTDSSYEVYLGLLMAARMAEDGQHRLVWRDGRRRLVLVGEDVASHRADCAQAVLDAVATVNGQLCVDEYSDLQA